MNEQIKRSLRRWGRFLLRVPSPNDYIHLTRKAEACRWKPLRLLLNYKRMRLARVFNLEISSTANIGENLHLTHGNGITINKAAIIGKNCVIFKNATIGSVRSGKRAGVPVIGDNCVICIGAFVGGGGTYWKQRNDMCQRIC